MRIGTPRISPSGPHIQPQNITVTNTATEFALAARPSAIGATRKPSIAVITTETPATSATIDSVLNCSSAAIAVATITIVGPKYGMQFSTPAATPHKPA